MSDSQYTYLGYKGVGSYARLGNYSTAGSRKAGRNPLKIIPGYSYTGGQVRVRIEQSCRSRKMPPFPNDPCLWLSVPEPSFSE